MMFLTLIDTPEDKGKFAILYEKYRYLMLKVAMDVLHDRFSAEDAVHNAFINLGVHMDSIGDMESLQTKRFLITIAKNAAIDIYRKKNVQKQREIFMDELGDEDLPLTYLETDLDNDVLDVLKKLPMNVKFPNFGTNNRVVYIVLCLCLSTLFQRPGVGRAHEPL